MPADPGRKNGLIISAALLALFLGALDALVMTAAMPTIIADLGGKSEETTGVKLGTRDEMNDIAKSLSGEYGIRALAIELDVITHNCRV